MSNSKGTESLFAFRSVICFFLICVICLGCVARVSVISSGDYKQISSLQNGYRITVKKQRGTIYDCNMNPITNNRTDTFVAIPPTPEGVISATEVLSGKDRETALEKLKNNEPVVCKINGKTSSSTISKTTVTTTQREEFISHIIGYTDSSGHGVCGIEKAYDDLLYFDNTVDAVFCVNGKGSMLYGVKPYFENDLSSLSNYVVTTIDNSIQSIAFDCAENLSKGAIVVCDAKSGKIRALVSKPSYNTENLSEYINRSDSPLLNRALSAFSVGSVFKPTVAAAAIENGKGDFVHNCIGFTHIIDRDFSCHKKDGHGVLDLMGGLMYSCNTYFYNLAFETGGEKMIKYAKNLNFGTGIKIGNNLQTEKGNLTDVSVLNNSAMLANFAIGQGDILLSPVSMLTLYLSVAGDGGYYLPSIIEKTSKNGKETKYDVGGKTKVMEKITADTLKEYLKEVVISGTGNDAFVENLEVAGKTATAQTGRYENGVEFTNSWFCGFFPVSEPKYVVVVMSDGQNKISTAKIFSQIAQRIFTK